MGTYHGIHSGDRGQDRHPHRGFYQASDGRYTSAGTFGTAERAIEVAEAAEKHAAALISGVVGDLDPVIKATRTIAEYKPIFMRHHRVEGNTKDGYEDTLRKHVVPFLGKVRLAETTRTVARNYFTALEESGRSPNTIRQAKVVLAAMFTMAVGEGYLDANPFHDQKTPRVGGPRAIKVATTDQYVKVRACLPTKAAKVFSTLMVSSGIRFCEAIALRPMDLDFDTCVLDVGRSVVQVSREHHPQGKTFLVREYTKNGECRRVKLDREVVQLVHAYAEENRIGPSDLLFPIELVVPPRATRQGLSPEEIEALGCTEPVRGRVYKHGTMGGYVTAKCRCAGCRQWAREYGREKARRRRAPQSGPAKSRWAKSRDTDEHYLDRKSWDRVWSAAVKESGIPFKPTAYQVRHTHA